MWLLFHAHPHSHVGFSFRTLLLSPILIHFARITFRSKVLYIPASLLSALRPPIPLHMVSVYNHHLACAKRNDANPLLDTNMQMQGETEVKHPENQDCDSKFGSPL